MEISWLGHSCFQLRGKNVTLITDPFSPQLGYTLGKVSAPIVTVSHNHAGHNYVEGVAGNPRVVRGPGEYEISDILITGVASYHDNKRGQELGRNTIYVIHMDDIVICHLGDLGHTLQVEQHIIIPMHYRTSALEGKRDTLDPLDKFCREMGVETITAQPKLVVTRNNMP